MQSPTNDRPNGRTVWDSILTAAFGLAVAGGLLLVFAPDFVGLGWLNRAVTRAFFPAGPPDGAGDLRRWLYTVEGATMFGFGVLGLAVVRTAFRRRERWARDGLALAIVAWFVLDSAGSGVYGVWANVGLNAGIAAALLLPIAATWRRFATSGVAVRRAARPSVEPAEVGPARIAWEPPTPREGWRGSLDRFFGPGTTPTEYLLQGAVIAVLTALIVALTLRAGSLELTWRQWLVLLVMAIEITGGIVTNATSPAKRWYHREALGFGDQLGFVALHGVHLVLFTLVLGGMGWGATALCYGLLLATAAVLLRVPLYLQRPLALSLYAGLLLLSFVLVPPASGFAWFLPFFFLKLEVSHLVREAPFRPGLSRGSGTIAVALVLLSLVHAPGLSAQGVGAPVAPDAANPRAVTGFWAFRWSRFDDAGCRLAGLGFELRLGDRTRVGVAGYGTARSARLDPGRATLAYAGVRVAHTAVRWKGWSLDGAVLAGGGRFRIEGGGSEDRDRAVAVIEPELLIGRRLGHLRLTAGVGRRWIPGDAQGLTDAVTGGLSGVLQLEVR